jgi:curved DNA-binding protein
MEFKDYYKILGVSPKATKEEIRKAFRKLARAWHPDVAKDKANADRRFKEINEAHEVLSDPQKRARYDQLGSAWNQPGGIPGGMRTGGFRRASTAAAGPGESGTGGLEDLFRQFGGRRRKVSFEGTGFSDFFESFFGGHGGSGNGGFGGSPFAESAGSGFGAEPPETPNGRDIEGDLMVTLNEVAQGAVREIRLRREGQTTAETIKVRVPAGVREGQRLRLTGKGAPAPVAGGQPGNLYLRVHLAPHPQLTPEGDDVLGEVEVEPWEAVLGSRKTVQTLEGEVHLRVAPGTQSGTLLRLRGRGLPGKDGSRGDLLMKVKVRIPQKLSPAEQAAWEHLASEIAGTGGQPVH